MRAIGLFFAHLRANLSQYLAGVEPWSVRLTLLLSFLLLWGARLLLRGRRGGRTPRRFPFLWDALGALYITALFAVTVLGRLPGNRGDAGMWTSIEALFRGSVSIRFDLLFNVLLFIPWGILLSFHFSPPFTLPAVLFTTVAIETAQHVTGRGLFEIGDILANFLGGCAGVGLYFAGKKIYLRHQNKPS